MGKVFLPLITAVIFLVIGALFFATRNEASKVVTVDSIIHENAKEKLRVRVAGRVTQDEIVYEVEPSFKLTFSVQDPKLLSEKFKVVYEGIKPDMFAAGRDVLLDGDYRDGVFYASSLLTQCPSKYEPPKS